MKIRYILGLLASFILVSCGQQTKEQTPTIMVTIEPLRYFTEAIVGDLFEVISMVPNGTSPETYDPTPQQLISFAKSEAYFRIGYIGFELSWMDKLQTNNPSVPIYDTSEGIELIYAAEHNHADHHHHGGVEPHTWNSTINAKIIAQNILSSIIKLDSVNKDFYKANYNNLIQEISDTDKKIQDLFANNNINKGFMIYHPALSYFARDFDLEQISIEEEGKEPTPGHLKKLIQECMKKNIHVIFIQPEFDKKNAEVIAEQTKSKIIPINPLTYHWHDEMLNVAKALIQ